MIKKIKQLLVSVILPGAKGVLLKVHTVVCDCISALEEVQSLVDGSDVGAKVKPHLDMLLNALGGIKTAVVNIGKLCGVEFAVSIASHGDALNRLDKSTKALKDN